MIRKPAPESPQRSRVLAVDPALRNTGYAVLEKTGNIISAVTFGVISNPPKLLPSGCLVAIREQLSEVIKLHGPTECAIESTIFVQSYKTAITLGSVRGAVLIAAAEHGLPIYDYAPREVKQAAVGRGAADKTQVAFMMRSVLRLRETPPPDAADALAVGIAHFQASAGHLAKQDVRREPEQLGGAAEAEARLQPPLSCVNHQADAAPDQRSVDTDELKIRTNLGF